MIRSALAAFVFVVATLPAGADDPTRAMVYELITERLALMEPVAAWKHANGVAIENREREAVVLDRAARDAAEAGMAEDSVRPFFEAQIAAAKAIQQCWIARWEGGDAPPRTDPPDLEADIRPKLLLIGTALLKSIRDALAEGVDFDPDDADKFTEAVDLDCLSPDARDAIHEGLGGIRLAR